MGTALASRLAPVALAAAALMALSLALFNPDLARTPLEWAELLGGLTAVCGGLGLVALAGGRRRDGGTAWAAWGLLAGCGLAAAGVGFLIAEWAGAAVAVLLFGALAVIWRLRRTPTDRRPGQVLVPALGTSLLWSVWALATGSAVDRQVILIGLDGADWPIVDRLRDEGRLPTFERLIRSGARAGLETVHPVLSPQVWTSIATGAPPSTHGVKDFWATSRDVRVKRFWEVADESGMTTGVMSYLVTWPPDKTTGFLVPGWLAQDARTFPADLEFLKRLEQQEKAREGTSAMEILAMGAAALRHGATLGTVNQAAGYYIRRAVGRSTPFHEAYAGRALKLSLTTDVFCHLLRRRSLDLGVFYYSSIDAIEHQFFQYYEPSYFPSVTDEEVAQYGDLIPRIYEAADAAVSRILDAAHPRATVVVVSDHGQQPATALSERWYVIRTGALLKVLGLGDSVRATNVGRGVFFRPRAGAEAEFEDAIRRLETEVRSVEGAPVFQVSRPAPDEALLMVHADFPFEKHSEVRAAGRSLPVDELINDAPQVSGEHTETAFFVMAGEGVAAGKTLPAGSVLDIAPTVLHLLGLPIARDLEGRVLVEAFETPREVEAGIEFVDTYGRPTRETDPDGPSEVDDQTLEKLKALGYVQ